MKSLVVYYTRTGTTRFVAQTIAAELGADLEEIVDLKKREGKLGWIIGGKDASQKKLTKIAPLKRSPADYDLLVIGTPIWAWAPTPAVRTYISQNDLTGKKVALFYTFGSDMKQAAERTKALLTNANVVSELPLVDPMGKKEETEQKIAEWCTLLKQF
ncbi:MAG: NAD(P)H-dependent oxidoreductase [Candidatus Bathyarchaeota archaeon]|nr:NAD(P)H-dependent oxidoreductase [Candidatus Bathyarchaeota archaeon]